jgi:hypothetical protein
VHHNALPEQLIPQNVIVCPEVIDPDRRIGKDQLRRLLFENSSICRTVVALPRGMYSISGAVPPNAARR